MQRLRSLVLLALGAAAAALTAATAMPSSNPNPADDPDSGAELIGRQAPDWTFTRWVRGGNHALADYRGKVVLVRWWTEGCHFCRTTLPVIDRLGKEHAGDLVVIGVFHPKPEPREVDDRHILSVAKQLGFSGPVAFDRDWKTLNRYWLDGNPDRNWTSVSFLIDKDGVIRWVQGGGEYHPTTDPAHARCDVEYRGLEKALAAALAAPPRTP
jgi:thiol-disulfide isomerase/thioredoxin